MSEKKLQIVIEQDRDGGYHASCLGLRGCYAYGETYSEALLNINEAIQSIFEAVKMKNGIEIDLHVSEMVWSGRQWAD